MPALKLYPLHLGTITRPKLIFMFSLAEMGKIIQVPITAWYIEGSDKKILVDTGGEDPANAPHRAPYVRENDQQIENALKKIGVRCEDIDIVINTHLHWDHSAGNGLFPNAKILVQEEELRWARSPLPLHAKGFLKDIAENINYTVISGDKEIVKGVSVVLTPGHTYGMQGVLVEAETQRYFLASDTVGIYDCLATDPPVVSGIYVDLLKYYNSFEKIAKLSATILPGHDFKVLEKQVYS